jgi:WD40 repeat protein/predicted DNA-binding WGR domain protein
MKQYLENIQGKSSKFWQIELDGQYLNVENGKIGGKGRASRKDLKTKEKAFLAFKREIVKKRKTGYADPSISIATLNLEGTPFNDTVFKHGEDVEAIHYYHQKNLVITGTEAHLYLWTTEGVLLDQYASSGRGNYFIREVPNSEQLLIYKKKTYRNNHLYIFDCSQNKLELLKEQKIDLPVKGYYGDIDLDEKYIYLGYTGGFMLLDYELNILKTLSSPQKHEDSSGTVVSAASQRIGFIEYGGRGDLDNILIVDLEGNKVAQFEAKAHGSMGMQAKFNASGTALYTVSSSNYETKAQIWEVEKGTLVKELINYSSSGGVLSFSISKDEKWLGIRVAGVDIIMWNVEDSAVMWVNSNEALWAKITVDVDRMYQSAGNRIYPVSLDSGEKLLEIKGLTAACRKLYFDNEQEQLWTISGKTACCFNLDRSVEHSLDVESFVVEKVARKMLLKRRYQNYGGSYSWFDLATREETPLFSGMFKRIDFDEDRILSTAGYFSREKKSTKLWGHSGKLLKEFKPSKDVDAYLWKEDDFIVSNGKTIEFWTIEDKKARLVLKNAHSKGIDDIVVLPNNAGVLSIAGNELKLWDGESDTALFFDLLLDEVKAVIVEAALAVVLIIDNLGNIYTFDAPKQILKQLAVTNKNITAATFRETGELYISTTDLEILKVDISGLLKIEIKEKEVIIKDTLDLSLLEGTATATDLLEFLQSVKWETLTEEVFLKIRTALENLEERTGIEIVHHYFTERLLASGAWLKHQFAHEEKMNSFAMSPNGEYLAVGTWVGDNYEEGGTVQIWELSTGRCVNLLKERYGGIGWPDYPYMLQWSTSGRYLGAGINTNMVAKLNPFSASASPLATACITNGWSRPATWTWQGAEDAFAISCWHNSEIPLGITSNKKLNSYEDNAKWMAPKLSASIKTQLNGDDLEPYKWCSATPDGQFVYGYNGHRQVYCIDVKSKAVAWVKQIGKPVGFNPSGNFMVYQDSDKLILAAIRTGIVESKVNCSISIKGIGFSADGKRYVVYNESTLLIYEGQSEIARLTLKNKLAKEARSASELRVVQFDPTGNKLVVLLENNKAQTWCLNTKEILNEFDCYGAGIYWGESIVGLGEYGIRFYKETGVLIQACDKDLQAKAYNELYDQQPPLRIGKKDWASKYEVAPNYPLNHNGRKAWVAVIPTGVVIGTELTVEILDQHLSYTYQNKYAWPYRWGGGADIYPTLYTAKDNPKLGLTSKEKTSLKAPKIVKKKKGAIDFTLGGSLLDVVNVHQKSLSELTGNWYGHISDHNGIIARKLILIGEYEKAISIVAASPEWYALVSNLGFVATDLAKTGALDFAKVAFDKGVEALEKGAEKDREGWAATFVYAPLGAAAHLLGLDEIAEKYFKSSYQELTEESNYFEKYLCLATCYLSCDKYEKAMEVMSDGPWTGHSLSSFQVEFMILLMDIGRLDLAMQYFDLGIEKCGKINEFDLLNKGFSILLEQKKYNAAIEWMKRFPGLSIAHCEDLLVEKYIEAGEKDLGTAYLLKEIERTKEHDGSVMKYLRLMSYINPEETKVQIKSYSTTTNAYYKDRYYEDFGRAKSNIGLLEDAFTFADKINPAQNKVLYLVDLLERPAEDPTFQLDILDKAIELLSSEDMVLQEIIKFHIKLSQIALKIGAKEKAAYLLSQADELANQIKGNDSSKIGELQKLYLKFDLLEASYKMFKKQTPKNRKYEMKPYALAIAQRGYWKTAAALLKTLPAKNLNDRPSAAMRIIEVFELS